VIASFPSFSSSQLSDTPTCLYLLKYVECYYWLPEVENQLKALHLETSSYSK